MRLNFEGDLRMFRSLFRFILFVMKLSIFYIGVMWALFQKTLTTKNQIFCINSIAVSCRQADRVRAVRKACVQEAKYTHKTPIFRAKTTSHK